MKNLTKKPLLHFILLGTLIFAGYAWFNRSITGKNELIISLAHQKNLARTFSRTWQRLPHDSRFKYPEASLAKRISWAALPKIF
jgi:hypothetical protein